MVLALKPGMGSPPATFTFNDLDDEIISSGQSSPEIPIADLPSPPTSWIPASNMKTYGAQPMVPEVPIVKCKDCDKPFLASALAEHAENCKQIRGKGAKPGKDGSNGEDTSKGGKKRKADDEGSVANAADGDDSGLPKKKKTKKELAKAASKGGRVKGPVNVDKQCGVINDKNAPCSRSITCKVHSMVAKRAVPGRSKPYDDLLLDWKRANIPDFVEPVKKETKAEKKVKKERERELKKSVLGAGAGGGSKKKGANAAGGAASAGGIAAGAAGRKAAAMIAQQEEEEEEDAADMDSDVEFDALLRAVHVLSSTSSLDPPLPPLPSITGTSISSGTANVIGGGPTPLARPDNATNFFITRNERLRCCSDILLTALKRAPSTSGVPNFGSGVGLGMSGEDVMMRS